MSNLDDFLGITTEEKPVEKEEKDKSITLFDILNSIYYGKNFILNEETNKNYVKFMINKGLSMGRDTIYYANEMNTYPDLTNNMHHDFLNGIVRKNKRFNKWVKSDKNDDINMVKFFMKCSTDKAKVALSLLDEEQLKKLRFKFDKIYN